MRGATLKVIQDLLGHSTIVMTIAFATVAITFRREYQAEVATEALQARIQTRVRVLRDAALVDLPAAQLVPGDIVELSAGSLVPADGVIVEAADCFVSESALTGESFPVQKRPGPVPAGATMPLKMLAS